MTEAWPARPWRHSTLTRNPLRDWNIVYVPYCTGDAQAGTKTTPTDVPNGPRGQYFVGTPHALGPRRQLARLLRRRLPGQE
jgi:hypothetical protein